MTRFFTNTRHDQDYPVDQIDSIGPAKEFPGGIMTYHEVLMRDGRKVLAYEHTVAELQISVVGFIPAAAGTSVIHDGVVMGEDWINRTSVIGWALRSDGSVVPVTPNGINDDMSRRVTVEMPGGEVFPYDTDARSYPSAAEYVADKLQEHRAQTMDALTRAEEPRS